MITQLGSTLINTQRALPEFISLALQTLVKSFVPPYRLKEVFRQIYFVANQSAFIVALCVSFAAMVTILEASFHMRLVIQNDNMVPGFAALLILRELGSVIAALLITSRVGAGLAAEVGTMQITEQIDALKMLSLDPIKFVVVPRFLACIFGGFLLSIVSNLVCLFCAMAVSTIKLGYTPGSFLTAMRAFVHFQDLIFAIVKGMVFGAVIPLFSCYHGFRCKAGAEGVGLATTNSVVSTSVAVIVLDFSMGWIFSHFY